MNNNARIYIAGHMGMVGSALMRNLQKKGYNNFVTRSLEELDLIRQVDVEEFFEKERPEYVLDAAAKVGGIMANNIFRAQFIYENIMIQNNIIHSSHKYGVKKLLFLGSSCIYPKDAPQPLKEETLLTGLLEPTNEPYAIAKISGIKMCESYFKQYGSNFISVMPTNLYGPNDNYDLEKSHVLPALIRKIHLGKCLENDDWGAIANDLNKNPIEGIDGNNLADKSSRTKVLDVLERYGIVMAGQKTEDRRQKLVLIKLWGSGEVFREFLHVDDMADACVHILQEVDAETLYTKMQQTHINIGTGEDLTIKELAQLVKNIIGFEGDLLWDNSKPDGTFKKQLDVTLLNKLKWEHNISLEEGVRAVYEQYCNTQILPS